MEHWLDSIKYATLYGRSTSKSKVFFDKKISWPKDPPKLGAIVPGLLGGMYMAYFKNILAEMKTEALLQGEEFRLYNNHNDVLADMIDATLRVQRSSDDAMNAFMNFTCNGAITRKTIFDAANPRRYNFDVVEQQQIDTIKDRQKLISRRGPIPHKPYKREARQSFKALKRRVGK